MPVATRRATLARGAVLAVAAFLLTPAHVSFSARPCVGDMGAMLAERYADRSPKAWGERLPGVVASLPPDADEARCGPAPRTVALTLDACGGKTDMRIIALLQEYGIPATVFVTNIWLRRNREIAENLARDPLFSLACHGARHKPASVCGRTIYGIAGAGSVAELVAEVESNARAVAALTGTRPGWYRSGTAHYDDVALAVIADLGLNVAGYTVSADLGASLPAGDVARRMLAAPDRAIILCHVNHPESGTAEGLARAIPAMLQKGVRFTRLPGRI